MVGIKMQASGCVQQTWWVFEFVGKFGLYWSIWNPLVYMIFCAGHLGNHLIGS